MKPLPLIETGLADVSLTVTSASAKDVARRLAHEAGTFGGFSPEANLVAALD